jgi:alpha-tubulin suppressor-like RCC1 family protein
MRLKARFYKLKKSVNHRKLSVALLIFFSSALMVLFNNCGSKFDTGVRPGEINSSSFSSEDPSPAPAPTPLPPPVSMPDPIEPPVIPPPVDPLPDPVVSEPPVVTNPPVVNNPPVTNDTGETLPQEPSGRCLPAAGLINLCSGGLCVSKIQTMNDSLRCYTSGGGKLKCSGTNTRGELGDGTSLPRATAVNVDSNAIYAKISTDYNNTCGLTRDCTIKCWGSRTDSLLGKPKSLLPESVDAASAYIDISVSDDLVCAINTAGEIKCWGDNSFVLGKTGAFSALKISEAGVKYKKLSQNTGGNHFCAISDSGILKCWGRNNRGQLGNGTKTDSAVPVVVDNGISYFSVLTYDSASYGITKMGELKFWGLPNDGATYIGDYGTVTPVSLDPGTRYVSLAGSSRITCALTDTGQLKCWGGTIGTPMTGLYQKTPTLVDGANKFVSIGVSRGAICGFTTSGSTRCMGDSTNGIFGAGQLGYALSPVVAPAFGEVSQISLGSTQSCKINLSGELSCIGQDSLAGGQKLQFTVVDSGQSYSKVSAGYQYGCAITTNGTLKCWGSGSSGNLGAGTAVYSSAVPLEIDPGTKYADVVTLSETFQGHTCGITTAGVLKCWGGNSQGQVGDGTKVNKMVPTVIDPGVNYINVFVSSYSTCGITSRGEKKCWGMGIGALPVASGTANDDYLLITAGMILGKTGKVYENSSVTESVISASGRSIRYCVVTAAGALKCWGSFPLGNGSLTSDSYLSTPLVIDSAIYKSVTTGNKTSCAILSDNRVKCWGFLNDNIAGFPATWMAASPITVSAP